MRRRTGSLVALTMAVSVVTACVPPQPHRELVDSRPTLPPTHIGAGGAVSLGRTESVGAWEITVLEVEREPREEPTSGDATERAMERRRVRPFVIGLRVARIGDRPARLRDTLTFQAYTRDGRRFVERTTVGKCAERTGATERSNPRVRGDDVIDVTICYFIKGEDEDGLFLAVRDAESGDARGFRLQATSH